MSAGTFQSFSQNGEDVILWRALRQVPEGRYVEVGANHPAVFSVSRGFYDRGWRGITIEPDPEFARMQREQRPRDRMVEAAVTTKDGGSVTLHVVDGTGLSTLDAAMATTHERSGFERHDIQVITRRLDSIFEEAGWQGLDIHFMSVDTEGSEKGVLESCDLKIWRPWVILVEATTPLTTQSTRATWEDIILESGYRFCLFDGLSCFYVAEEHAQTLGPMLSYPACVLDDYTTREYRELTEKLEAVPRLVEQVSRWRNQALTRWATVLASQSETDRLGDEVAELQRALHDARVECARLNQVVKEMRGSTSWRASAPLRVFGRLARRGRRFP